MERYDPSWTVFTTDVNGLERRDLRPLTLIWTLGLKLSRDRWLLSEFFEHADDFSRCCFENRARIDVSG